MNKNLISVIVPIVGILVISGLWLLLDQLIPSQTYKTFTTTMGMVRYIINVLVAFLIIYGGVFPILRKYGAQITPVTSSKMRIVALIIFLISFGILAMYFVFYSK